MARYEHLPIYKKAFDLVLYFEKIVRNFSRYNKYTFGTDLRNLSREILKRIIRANNANEKIPDLLELREKLEELKVLIRICKEADVFPNFNTFQYVLNEVVVLSRQNEGWLHSCRKIEQPEFPSVNRRM